MGNSSCDEIHGSAIGKMNGARQPAVVSDRLPSMETEIDDKMPSNSR